MEYQFISWNIDSLNAALTGKSPRSDLTRAVLQKIVQLHPTVLAIQETKLSADQNKVKKLLQLLTDYFPNYAVEYRISEPPARKGYAGTMMLYLKSLPQPQVTFPHIGAPEPTDDEGRMITLEFPEFFVTTVYTPNAGQDLNRLALRQEWDDCYRQYLTQLDQQKPVLACGDFNVAHEEIDLAHPQNNHHSSGFTDEERKKFSQLLAAGFTDSFRYLYPQAQGFYQEQRSVYTWFPQRVRTSKQNNSGWRIDYWLVSNRLADKIEISEPLATGERQDHLPILLKFSM
ncbi:exodeoxyribonuclease III [Bombilactobacillus bombi]|uniref:exodeoxyribonuclease III n=1 Tax=Bombilactobacillus bombi TaxID=1303590 RepID=UPI000E56BDCC|nr:exodeoxyribonuclease III [Bombilactobacillus bombi]AXX65159.1 exodeoxyribonuclease III [Bombilactobacillus bombi]